MTHNAITRAVRYALLASAAAASAGGGTAALAQDQDQEQAESADVQTVVVTGSRIPNPNLTSTSPVSVIDDQEIGLQGITQVEDLLNNLPQAFADQGGNVSNGSTGTATVNLRNLGPTRTLVLVNGRRLPAGTPGGTDAATAPDLNQIPAMLIERVEVLTGGASAVYGSDAVAGVVNFIMKDDFEGISIQGQYSTFQHGNDHALGDIVAGAGFETPDSTEYDGDAKEIGLLMGLNLGDGRGNATLHVGYRELAAVLQSERDYSACALGTDDPGTSFTCSGSGTTFPGLFIPNGGDSDNLFTIADANGNIRPFGDNDLFNFGPYNYYQRPDKRYTLDAFAHYDVNDYAEVYTELMVHDDRTPAQIAPSGLFATTYQTNCDNPLLSPAQVQALCTDLGLAGSDITDVFIGRRNVEGGGRVDDLQHTSYRGVVGLRGDIGQSWTYDVYAQYGTVVFAETYRNDFSIVRGQRALFVGTDPATGQPACLSAIDGTDPNCAPYNIWQLGGVSDAALEYIQTPGFQRGDTTQTVFNASLTSNLGDYGVKSPGAEEGLGIAFGVEYRDEGLSLETDAAFSTGDLSGQGGPTIGVAGGFDVIDYFVELRAPLLEDKPGADYLSLDLGYRFSDYSTDIETDSFKVGGDWAPVEDIRFRGSFQRAVRAPNVRELFAAQAVGLFDLTTDPCSGATPQRSLAECQLTGVTPAQYGSILNSFAGQFNALFGGNLELEPESSDTLSFGVVFTPSFIDNFTVALDYFNITLEDQISQIPPTETLGACLDTGDPALCGLINRGQNGTLWADPNAFIVATNINIAEVETSGFDLETNYGFTIGDSGRLAFNLIGTYLDEFVQEPIPGVVYDCKGFYGATCLTPLPEWRHKLRATWTSPWNFDLSFSWRFIDAVNIDLSSTDPDLQDEFAPINRTLGSQSYFDIAGAWQMTDTFSLRLGINNVLDEDPPVSSAVGTGFGNGNTYPQVYDALGRYGFFAVTATF
jgi:iron complex outermembrane recepter protein